MATSRVQRSLCKHCNKAPSVSICQGCQKDFCSPHAKEHRQELSKQLDTIILEHDLLKQKLNSGAVLPTNHPLMKQIDQWEKESIEKIRIAANDARNELANQLNITEKLNVLSKEVATAQSEDDFNEIDLKEWMDQLKQLTQNLNAPSTVNIRRTNEIFIQKIVVGSPGSLKIFETCIGPMKIEDNGHVIISNNGGHSTARCSGEYTSGQHCIRFKIEQQDSRKWMHFGVVSKNIVLQASSYNTPTTFGWNANSYVICNGVGVGNLGYLCDILANDIIKLFIDSDRQLIRLTNERTNYQHEIQVNINQCPFPWRVHIGLHYQNDRVRILSD